MTSLSRCLREGNAALTAVVLALGLLVSGQGSALAQRGGQPPSFLDAPNAFGVQRTITLDGSPLNQTGPFFQNLGTNGRSCVTCHLPTTGWTVSPAELQTRFSNTQGFDPVFQTNDGSNSPLMDVSTVAARQQAYSMLLNNGVIRIGLSIPANAEFALVPNPDGSPWDVWGWVGNPANATQQLSLFRRPLASTNLRFLTGVMWDGRESSTQTGTQPIFTPVSTQPILPQLLQDFENLLADLAHQSNDATLGHAQAMVPGLTPLQQAQIVGFEFNLATAQNVGPTGESLSANGAQGGPNLLVTQLFYVSINDSAGGDVFGNAFNPAATTLFNAYAGSSDPLQASIARGQTVFNTFQLGAGAARTCTTCHGSPNVGNRSLFRTVNLNVSDPVNRYSGLPLYTLKNNTTGATIQTTDPGIAMITGLWADVNKFRVPTLRGVAAQAPYFHNGMSPDLQSVINFYEGHFGFSLTSDQNTDLLNFLQSL